jgi:hypothetical protein
VPPHYVVYQMGKVGSSTVYESLRAAGVAPLDKVHYLSREGLERARRSYAGFDVQVPVPYEQVTERLQAEIAARRTVLWKVITLVREPIARDVSAYLQMVDLLHPDLASATAPQLDKLARAAAAQFIGFDESRSYTCRWFDDEFARAFGIDVFEFPFDPAQGWQRIRQPNVDVLVLRLEDVNRVLEEALHAFCGRPVPMVRASSRSAEKLQAVYVEDIYRQIVGRLRIPEATCRRVYASRYARHFYNPSEIECFVERWAQRRVPEQATS